MVEISSLSRLSTTLKDLAFIFPQADFQEAEAKRKRVIHKLDNHMLPRLRNLNAPLVCVLAGSTGSGKSTIVNSLLQTQVASASAVRPTTRRPLLLHAPADAVWFKGTTVLPQLAKVRVEAGAPPTPVTVGNHSEIEIREHASLLAGLALIDAPDFDSIAEENRVLSRQLLDVADMWIFVTTATRYADALPWEILKEAKSRNITIAVVLNRTPEAALAEIQQDLQRLLTEAGLENLPLIAIPELPLENGFIPPQKVAKLSEWMLSFAADSQVRIATAMRSLLGTGRLLVADAQDVKTALDRQFLLVADAHSVVDTEARHAVQRVSTLSADGSLLKGEVLARWQEIVGVSELSQIIERGIGLFKFRLKSFFTGQKPELNSLEVALESSLQTIVASELLVAESRVRKVWAGNPQMRELEAQIPDLDVDAVEARAKEITLRWQHNLLELIRSEGGSRRTTARVMAAGVNLLGVALMIVIFASTGGITGAEIGVAGTTSVVAQKLLEVIFGDQAVKAMTAKAHSDLVAQVSTFYESELAKLRAGIPQVADSAELSGDLTAAQDTLNELENEVRARLGKAL
ncbi:hypothetical protein HMPREF0044_1332 [Gleimia coleocanis DSM 15436]|uniref:Dynamin N-terminal domain-containing protein n=1 Tax=Gleimia coleocanis DSM 15436 TaxID=525245 RepID=C0W1P2_9ACTO|nr:GTPase domain-containing protein [Gleimia coleocanis]EEH63408.1 hypothetical protein HMPREF0044_1332 [Gleimia coleocanis DSM 15436]